MNPPREPAYFLVSDPVLNGLYVVERMRWANPKTLKKEKDRGNTTYRILSIEPLKGEKFVYGPLRKKGDYLKIKEKELLKKLISVQPITKAEALGRML